jgi:cytoskeleton protein RodZ
MSEAVLDAPAAGEPATSPGAQLAAARESRGMSVADVAHQLKLSPWQVEALESGDYRRLPGAVFVRGFIRNYARLLKIDSALLLANSEHDMPHTAPAAPEKPPSADIPFPTERKINWHKYAVPALAVLIGLVIFEFYYDDAQDVTVKTRQVELPAPQVMAETSPEPIVAPGVAPPPAPVKEEPPAQPLPKARQRTPEAAAAALFSAPASGEQVVRLRFARESWVEIRDRNGRKIFSQLNSPGSEQVVSGLPPLSLIVGNANGVQLIHNQQPVNLGPHTKVDVARLTLE